MKKIVLFPLLILMNWGLLMGDTDNTSFYSSPEVEKNMDLVRQLEGHGYDRSAIHYLKKTLRVHDLSESERKVIEKRLEEAQERMDRSELKVLPDLEVMLHMDRPAKTTKPRVVDPVAALSSTTPVPGSFPSNRINKMKWFKVAAVVVVTGAIAYEVTKHLKQKGSPAPNSVTITF